MGSKAYITQQVYFMWSGLAGLLRQLGREKVMDQEASWEHRKGTVATWVYSMDAVMTLTGDLKKM